MAQEWFKEPTSSQPTSWHDESLHALHDDLMASGAPDYSEYALAHQDEPKARCCTCNIYYCVSELTNGCPRCKNPEGDFDYNPFD